VIVAAMWRASDNGRDGEVYYECFISVELEISHYHGEW
jgi:hypothetical protein